MDLFRWIGVGSSHQTTSNAPHGPKGGGVKQISHADYKQFGLENFGNTCYANSVLQALYFCQPFRELVCDSRDGSNPRRSFPFSAPPQPMLAPLARPPGLKNLRRRDLSLDGGRDIDDPPANGLAAGKFNTMAAGSAPPIPLAPPTLFSALRSLFLHIALNPSDKGTISPTSFINKVKKENELYRSSMHQDAHEFLGFLLNKIVEDLEAEMKKSAEKSGDDVSSAFGSSASTSTSTTSPSQSNSSDSQKHPQPSRTFVHSLFEGTLTSETRCLTCETVSSRDESFLDLSIDIEQNSSVTACLRQFSASEMLSQKNKFFCDSCGGLQEAEKRMKIKKLPNVLALHLKRFKYQEDVQKYIKLSYRVAFPFELRLFNTVDDAPDPDRLYQLFAIVVHIGGGPHHGHYIAIIKAHGTWFIFDDDTVEAIREVDIPKYFGESPGGAGYVLFYQAVDLDLASVGIDATVEDAAPEAQTEVESSAGAAHEHAESLSASQSPAQLKVEIPITSEPQTPSAAPTVTPTTRLPNGNTGIGSSSGVSPGRSLKHSQSVRLTGGEQDRRQASSLERPSGEANGSVNGDATHVPWVGAPLVHTKSLKGKEKEGGTGGWLSSLKKDKKDKRPTVVPVPPLPAAVVDSTGIPSERGTLDLESPLSSKKLPIRPDEEIDIRLSRVATSRRSRSSIVTQSPAPAQPLQPPQPPSNSSSPAPISSVSLPSQSISSPSLPSPISLSAPVPHPFDPPIPIPPMQQRLRKHSQSLPPPSPAAVTLERPSTSAGTTKSKRTSRKMSLTGTTFAAFFGRKDKDRERAERERSLPPPPPPPPADRSQSEVASRNSLQT